MDYPNLISLKNIHTDMKMMTLVSFGWWDMGNFYIVLNIVFIFSATNIYCNYTQRESDLQMTPMKFS